MSQHIPIPLTSDRLILTPAEFGALFGRSKTWAYRLVYAGIIHPLRSTPSLMIPRSEVDRLLADTGAYVGRPAVKCRSAAPENASARPATPTHSKQNFSQNDNKNNKPKTTN